MWFLEAEDRTLFVSSISMVMLPKNSLSEKYVLCVMGNMCIQLHYLELHHSSEYDKLGKSAFFV